MKNVYKAAIVVLSLLYLAEIMTPADLAPVIFIAAVIVFLSGMPFMSKGFRKATVIFFLLGLFLLIKCSQPPAAWMLSFNSMTNIIVILAVMQLFTIPIETGEYNLAVSYLLKKFCRSEGRLFLFMMTAIHLFSSFLALGSIPIIISLMKDTVKDQVSDYKRFMAVAASRGFALGTLWTPGAVTILLTGQVTGASWAELFLPGLFLGAAGLALSYFLELKQARFSGFTANLDFMKNTELSLGGEKKIRSKAWHVALVAASLSILTFLLIRLKVGSPSTAVILSGVLVFLAWIAFLGKVPRLKTGIKNYWNDGILKAGDIAPFFIAIGVFSGALQYSGIEDYWEMVFQGYADGLGLSAIVLIPLTMILLSVVGIHPFISIVMLGQFLMSLHLPLPTITIALCLTLGGSASYMVSPFAGIIITISNLVGVKAFDAGIRWNWLFCSIYFPFGIITAYFLGRIFP